MSKPFDGVLYRNSKLGQYHFTNDIVSELTNYTGIVEEFCSLGELASSCSVPRDDMARAQYDALPTPSWLMLKSGTNRIVSLNVDGAINSKYVTTFVTLAKPARSFIYRETLDGDMVIDYCAVDGSLNSHNITRPAQAAVYNLLINALKCSGKTMNYNATLDSLIFPALQNGLSTIIEYKLSP